MRFVFRRSLFTELTFYLRSVNPNPKPYAVVSSVSRCSSRSSMYDIKDQFEEFLRQDIEDSSLRERIRRVTVEIEFAAAHMRSDLHSSGPTAGVLEKGKGHINVLRELYSKLAENIKHCPEQYYRYHDVWSSDTQMVVSQLALIHWLETESLLQLKEAEEKLALKSSKFGLDRYDYLTGLCIMSDELLLYTVKRVWLGDYDCPRKAVNLLSQLDASLCMLVPPTDFLREKFDGVMFTLAKVQHVLSDTENRIKEQSSATE